MQRSTPEEQGISASVIDRFFRVLDDEVTDASSAVHNVMVLRHGFVIGEASWHPFRTTDPHMLYSLSKSFTSTAIGLAAFERKLTVDDLVVDLLPDDLPDDVSANLAAMRVRDLLTMTTGHAADSMPPYSGVEQNWARAILAQPIEFKPGTHFVYNSGATYLLAAILTRITGQRMLDYLTPRLLDPLGITGATWEQCPRGIDVGGWGMAISTEDIATFGQLMLDGGVHEGRQLVPVEWVADATSAQVSNGDATLADDGTQGYGYQFWRCQHGAFRADGAFGQMSIVIPEHDTVVAFTSGHHEAQNLRDIVWSVLLPGLESGLEAGLESPASTDARAHSAFELPHPVGGDSSGSDRSGLWMLDENPIGITALALETRGTSTALRLTIDGAEFAIECGHREWVPGLISAGLHLPGLTTVAKSGGPIATSGAWTDTSFTAVIWFTETPYAQLITVTFDGDSATVVTRPNVSFADPIVPVQIAGRRHPVQG